MIVDVNELKRVKAYMDEINHADFRNIIWVEDGKECIIPEKEKTLEEWAFAGLNHCEFVFTGCYKEGINEK